MVAKYAEVCTEVLKLDSKPTRFVFVLAGFCTNASKNDGFQPCLNSSCFSRLYDRAVELNSRDGLHPPRFRSLPLLSSNASHSHDTNRPDSQERAMNKMLNSTVYIIFDILCTSNIYS